MRIEIAEPAVVDFQTIEDYIRQDNPKAAKRTVLRVFEAIEYLEKYPTMGRVGRVPTTRELIVSGTPFIVIYQIREASIFVLRILHASRKWPA